MKRRGIDISANRTKHLDEFVARRFDMVITLCDRVREVCPEFPVPSAARPLEHPRSRARGHNQPRLLPRVRTHGRRSSRRASDTCSTNWPNLTPGEDQPMHNDETVSVRYMVDDVDESIAFYTKVLGFEVLDERPARLRRRQARPPPAPARGSGQLRRAGPCPTAPSPDRADGTASTSSWTTSTRKSAGCATPAREFRNDILEGPGGKQILLLDPSGNVVELFQPRTN